MFSESGAKGIGSFSTGISYGILPSPSSLAHEGLIRKNAMVESFSFSKKKKLRDY